MRRITIFRKINLLKFLYYNYLCKKIKRDKGKYLFPFKGAMIEIHRNARIEIHENFFVGSGKLNGSREEAFCQLYENSFLEVKGEVTLAYGAMIQIHKNAKVAIGICHINTRATIIADKEILIGNDVLISRDVTIFDSDFHQVINEHGNITNKPSFVHIDDHVWIGVKATILRGVHLYTGSVIGAMALVTSDVKEKVMVSAIPGRGFGLIEWRS